MHMNKCVQSKLYNAWLKNSSFVFRSQCNDNIQINNDDVKPKFEFSQSFVNQQDSLWKVYDEVKKFCKSKKLPQNINPHAVYANNELNLEEIKIYGFDYDYTLACYKKSMYDLIYKLALNVLIKEWKYPNKIENLLCKPDFVIRGLHYDIEKGLLIKLDSFHQIQLGTVYRGLNKVSDDEVLELYNGTNTVPISYLEGDKSSPPKMQIMADFFSIPEMCLLTNITHFFISNNIDYLPEILFDDVKKAVKSIHSLMHNEVKRNVAEYLKPSYKLKLLLGRLKAGNKKLFLITNSPVGFVKAGLNYLIGENWQNIFDIIICNARKPTFFTNYQCPFRLYNSEDKAYSWTKIETLESGNIYLDGNVYKLQEMTGWKGSQVLYFGDHPYSDLKDVTLHHCWQTGAVREINIMNTSYFKEKVNWLQILSYIIEDFRTKSVEMNQVHIIKEWEEERKALRQELKDVFNQQFGSVFRTHHNPTYFGRRLFRVADIYTSNIENLLQYSLNHVFYPRRGALPHEYRFWFL